MLNPILPVKEEEKEFLPKKTGRNIASNDDNHSKYEGDSNTVPIGNDSGGTTTATTTSS